MEIGIFNGGNLLMVKEICVFVINILQAVT